MDTKLEQAQSRTNEDKLASSFSVLDKHKDENDYYYIELSIPNSEKKQQFWAHPQVFSPKYFKSTEILLNGFPFKENQDFCEIGCASGVTSIIAAKYYSNRVVAIDLNEKAVELALKNVDLHNMQGKVDVRLGSVFEPLKDSEVFDVIYWDTPYVFSEIGSDLSMLQRAVSDPGYKCIEEFLKENRKHLKEGGRLLVGFGSGGDQKMFQELCEKYGYVASQLFCGYHPYRDGIFYLLLQLKLEEKMK